MATNIRGLMAVEPRTFIRRLLRETDPWFGGGEVPFFAFPGRWKVSRGYPTWRCSSGIVNCWCVWICQD